MSPNRILLLAGLWLAAPLAFAQPAASTPGVPCPRGAVTAASAVPPCPQTAHPMRAGRPGAGWSDQALMTPAERRAHRAKMASFTSYDECHAYADQHHQEMMARAQAKGASAPAVPPRDACLRLKPAAK